VGGKEETKQHATDTYRGGQAAVDDNQPSAKQWLSDIPLFRTFWTFLGNIVGNFGRGYLRIYLKKLH